MVKEKEGWMDEGGEDEAADQWIRKAAGAKERNSASHRIRRNEDDKVNRPEMNEMK